MFPKYLYYLPKNIKCNTSFLISSYKNFKMYRKVNIFFSKHFITNIDEIGCSNEK